MSKRKNISISDLDDFNDLEMSNAIDGKEFPFPEFDFIAPKFKTRSQTDASGEVTNIKVLEGIAINNSRLRYRLEKWGFLCQTIDKTRFFFRLQDNIIEEVTDEQIRDFMDEKIRSMPDKIHDDITKEMVENKFLSGNENLLRKTIINRLRPVKPIEYLEDTADTAYFFYQNCIVEVTRTGIKTIQYKDNDKVVFKGNVLKRDYHPLEKTDFSTGIYYQFLQNIFDGHKTTGKQEREYNRMEEAKTVIGYLLHKFFKRKLKVPWWLDSRGDANAPKGRSGKGLIMKGCLHMMNADELNDKICVEIDGKELDQGAATKYDKCSIDTKLIHLNDIEHYFKISSLFNAITEGFKIRQLYKAPFTIRCKAAITSNWTPRTDSDSVKDRIIEVQTTNYYSAKFSPDMDFGKWFFSDDFTALDWLQFDNTMLHCVQVYLQQGLKQPEHINLGNRKLQETTNTDFIDFMKWYEEEKIRTAVHIVTKEEFINDFVRMFPDYQNKITSKKITYWVRNYTQYHFREDGETVFEPFNEDKVERYDTVIKDELNNAKRAFIFYKNQIV